VRSGDAYDDRDAADGHPAQPVPQHDLTGAEPPSGRSVEPFEKPDGHLLVGLVLQGRDAAPGRRIGADPAHEHHHSSAGRVVEGLVGPGDRQGAPAERDHRSPSTIRRMDAEIVPRGEGGGAVGGVRAIDREPAVLQDPVQFRELLDQLGQEPVQGRSARRDRPVELALAHDLPRLGK
jgi:hypothetical protein